MELCGNVMTNSKYEMFRLKCLYCSIESELKDWELFIVHVKSAHYCEDEDVRINEIKEDTEELYSVVDAADPAIAYGPDEFFEVIENSNGADQWMEADSKVRLFHSLTKGGQISELSLTAGYPVRGRRHRLVCSYKQFLGVRSRRQLIGTSSRNGSHTNGRVFPKSHTPKHRR